MDFTPDIASIVVAVASSLATVFVLGIYRRLGKTISEYQSNGRKIDGLERNLKVLVFVLSDTLPSFRDRWNQYAQVEGVHLIEESGGN